MGITTRVARRNGYRGDVCNMPESQVYAIYKKDYWDILPVNLAYPEKLALFNITINGSSRRCKNKSTAEAMLACQQKYYESLRVFWRFGKGWTARNNCFISLIQQLRREGH
jgi:lysozyme family protein